jgi:O-antigen polymerase
MNPIFLAVLAISVSLLIAVLAYLSLSKHEGSSINILTPSFLTAIPAFYLLPLVYLDLFGAQGSTYAHLWVYLTVAVETLAFVFAYTRTGNRLVRLPGLSSYSNFGILSLVCLGAGILLYVPVLVEFSEFLLDPRQIYIQTRTGFGTQSFISSTLAYIAVILILFSKRSRIIKVLTIFVAIGLLSLHGSKAQIVSVLMILLLYYVYVLGRRISLARAVIVYACLGALVLVLFAATMSLGEDAADALEAISGYADYTRNAMLVIDSHYPLQYGRLTIESNTLAVVPRQLMPGKPKNFGSFALAEEFFPESFDKDAGSPAFGVGLQYADFGSWAVVYVALVAALKGWLARIFVNRLKLTKHPADFFVVVFLADISVFPVGVGWLLPEALLVAVFLRWASRIGAGKVYRERQPGAVFVQPRPLRQAGGGSSA